MGLLNPARSRCALLGSLLLHLFLLALPNRQVHATDTNIVAYYVTEADTGILHGCTIDNDCQPLISQGDVGWSTFVPTSVAVVTTVNGRQTGLFVANKDNKTTHLCKMDGTDCEVVLELFTGHNIDFRRDATGEPDSLLIATPDGLRRCNIGGGCTYLASPGACHGIRAEPLDWASIYLESQGYAYACRSTYEASRCMDSASCEQILNSTSTGYGTPQPRGMDFEFVDGQVAYYVIADPAFQRVMRCAKDGSGCESIDGDGTAGSGAGQVNVPADVVVERDDYTGATRRYWIADRDNSRVKVCPVGGTCSILPTNYSGVHMAMPVQGLRAQQETLHLISDCSTQCGRNWCASFDTITEIGTDQIVGIPLSMLGCSREWDYSRMTTLYDSTNNRYYALEDPYFSWYGGIEWCEALDEIGEQDNIDSCVTLTNAERRDAAITTIVSYSSSETTTTLASVSDPSLVGYLYMKSMLLRYHVSTGTERLVMTAAEWRSTLENECISRFGKVSSDLTAMTDLEFARHAWEWFEAASTTISTTSTTTTTTTSITSSTTTETSTTTTISSTTSTTTSSTSTTTTTSTSTTTTTSTSTSTSSTTSSSTSTSSTTSTTTSSSTVTSTTTSTTTSSTSTSTTTFSTSTTSTTTSTATTTTVTGSTTESTTTTTTTSTSSETETSTTSTTSTTTTSTATTSTTTTSTISTTTTTSSSSTTSTRTTSSSSTTTTSITSTTTTSTTHTSTTYTSTSTSTSTSTTSKTTTVSTSSTTTVVESSAPPTSTTNLPTTTSQRSEEGTSTTSAGPASTSSSDFADASATATAATTTTTTTTTTTATEEEALPGGGMVDTTSSSTTQTETLTKTSTTRTRTSSTTTTTTTPLGMTSTTTTTTTTTRKPSEVEAEIVESLNASVIEAAQNGAEVTVETDDGVVTVCGLTVASCGSSDSSGNSSTSSGSKSVATVEIPLEVADSVGHSAILVIAPVVASPEVTATSSTMETASAASAVAALSGGTSATKTASGTVEKTTVIVEPASEAVSVQIVDENGDAIEVSDLESPISIGFNVDDNLTAEVDKGTGELVCLYWSDDRGEWSSDGLTLVRRNTTGAVICETSHLTVFMVMFIRSFGATLMCTNLEIFSSASLVALASFGSWVFSLPALLYYCLLAVFGMLLVFSARLDVRRRDFVRDDYYFKREQEDEGQKEEESKKGCLAWCDRFKRAPEEEGHQQAGVVDSVLQRLRLHCMKADVAAETWIAPPTMISSGLVGKTGALKWDDKTQGGGMSAELLDLHRKIATLMPKTMVRAVKDDRFRMLWKLFVFWHPFFGILCFDVEYTALRRALALTNSVLGSMLVTVLFFQTTGAAMSLEADPICEDPTNPIRLVLASAFGTVVAVLPVLLSTTLSKRRVYIAPEWSEEQTRWHTRKWNCLSKTMWCVDILWLLICITATLSFFANLNKVDYWKWSVAFVTIVVRWILMMPFVYAFVLVLVVQGVQKLKPEAFSTTDRSASLENIENDQIREQGEVVFSARDLLLIYKKLGRAVPGAELQTASAELISRTVIAPLVAQSWADVGRILLDIRVRSLGRTAEEGADFGSLACYAEVVEEAHLSASATFAEEDGEWKAQFASPRLTIGQQLRLSLLERASGQGRLLAWVCLSWVECCQEEAFVVELNDQYGNAGAQLEIQFVRTNGVREGDLAPSLGSNIGVSTSDEDSPNASPRASPRESKAGARKKTKNKKKLHSSKALSGPRVGASSRKSLEVHDSFYYFDVDGRAEAPSPSNPRLDAGYAESPAAEWRPRALKWITHSGVAPFSCLVAAAVSDTVGTQSADLAAHALESEDGIEKLLNILSISCDVAPKYWIPSCLVGSMNPRMLRDRQASNLIVVDRHFVALGDAAWREELTKGRANGFQSELLLEEANSFEGFVDAVNRFSEDGTEDFREAVELVLEVARTQRDQREVLKTTYQQVWI